MSGLSVFETVAVWCILLISIIGLAYALFLRNQVMSQILNYNYFKKLLHN